VKLSFKCCSKTDKVLHAQFQLFFLEPTVSPLSNRGERTYELQHRKGQRGTNLAITYQEIDLNVSLIYLIMTAMWLIKTLSGSSDGILS